MENALCEGNEAFGPTCFEVLDSHPFADSFDDDQDLREAGVVGSWEEVMRGVNVESCQK